MFEITGKDIAALNAGDLRSLVALLCEAELRSRDLPTSCHHGRRKETRTPRMAALMCALPCPPTVKIDGFVPRAQHR